VILARLALGQAAARRVRLARILVLSCYHEVWGFRRADGGWTPHFRASAEGARMKIRCRTCIGCRVRARDQWKTRCLHEASLHQANSFVTLTYDEEHLPAFGSCRISDVSSFVKRLRDRVKPVRFRFLFKTEYGPQTLRPHAHGLLFGLDFPDRVPARRTKAGELSYRSELLMAAWGKGVAECSDLTPRSVGYVANHNIDKLEGAFDPSRYERVDQATGEVVAVERESVRVSTHPGIGRGWLDRFESDCFPSGYVVVDGGKRPVPDYYKRRLKGRFSFRGTYNGGSVPFDDARFMAEKAAEYFDTDEARANSTPERLAVREEVLHLRLKRLKRDEF